MKQLIAPFQYFFQSRPGWKTAEPIASQVLAIASTSLTGGALISQLPAALLPSPYAHSVSMVVLLLVTVGLWIARPSLGFERCISFLGFVIFGFALAALGGLF